MYVCVCVYNVRSLYPRDRNSRAVAVLRAEEINAIVKAIQRSAPSYYGR